MKRIFYVNYMGEGVIYSPLKGNYWGKIKCYSLGRLDSASKRIAFDKIPNGSFINNYGTKSN